MSQFDLPGDVIYNMLLDLPYEDIINYCQSNKYINKLCQNNYLWKNKFYRDFSNLGIDEFFPRIETVNLGNNIIKEYNKRTDQEISWRNEYHRVYSSKEAIKTIMIHLLTKNGIQLNNINRKYDVYDIGRPDLYLLGIFLLPLNDAKFFLNLYAPYSTSYRFNLITQLPNYLTLMYKWLNEELPNRLHPTLSDINESIHKIPTAVGSGYGYRNVLGLLALNNYTPEQAHERLKELNITYENYKVVNKYNRKVK